MLQIAACPPGRMRWLVLLPNVEAILELGDRIYGGRVTDGSPGPSP